MTSNSPPTTSDGSKYAVESMPIASPDKDHPAAEAFRSRGNPPSPKSTTHRLSFDAQAPNVSSLQGRLRSASKNFQESNPPTGMWIATSQIVSSMPLLSDVRRGSFGSEGWSEGQIIERERRASLSRSFQNTENPKALGMELRHQSVPEVEDSGPINSMSDIPTNNTNSSARVSPFDNGYQFPPKHTWGESTKIFLVAFWKFFTTPIGFLVTIYGLNVIAWGGMLFLLLCNASPAMCSPTCNDINSPRRVWIEIDSQILNALFCVTGFGTIPWRFRDLYYLLRFRIKKNELGLRRLAGINRSWFRLNGSQALPVNLGPMNIETEISNINESQIPIPIIKIPKTPLTGIRAPPTAMWKLDFVVWTMVWNTFLQAVLSGFMWGLNRYKRPSWSTGLFVALACIVAACGGIMSFVEGKHVKSIEGVPISEKDQERLKRDRELGITHWNNINDEKPKKSKAKRSNGGRGLLRTGRKMSMAAEVEESATNERLN